jgi:hypothetical protein
MSIHAITYANQRFSRMARLLGMLCIKNGYSSFSVFNESDLSNRFRSENSETLSLDRGAGYWLWKPYIIRKVTGERSLNDVIHYLDAGTIPKFHSQIYSSLAENNLINVWCLENSRLLDWIEPSVLEDLDGMSFSELPMIQASGILSKNNPQFKVLLNEWLNLCLEPKYLRPETLGGYKKSDGFIWHRHDMSLLTVLVYKNPDLFKIHGQESSKAVTDYYYQHRNEKIKFLFLVIYFERFRLIRRYAVDLLPTTLRIKLREMKSLSQKRDLTKSEIESLRKIY